MDLSKVWQWYCEQHLSPRDLAALRVLPLAPDAVLAGFWAFQPLFTGRMDAIKAVPYSTDFDDSADEALVSMAMTDSFEGWDAINAGTWRVLHERFLYCSTVVAANMAAGTAVIDRVPAGLSLEATSRALLLKYLLGHGRTIDRKVLPLSGPGTVLQFPGAGPIRRQ